MYYYNEENIKLSEVFKICMIFTLFILLVIANYHYAFMFCDFYSIPLNLQLSIMSIGFGYELTLVSTCIEIGFIGYSMSKLLNIVEK